MINCNKKQNFGKDACKKRVGEALFVMILPKADNSGRKIKVGKYGKYVDKINSNFGGSTIKPITLGCWEDKERKKLQCEAGFSIETWRDFDADDKMQKWGSKKRKSQLKKDFSFMKSIAKESAEEFGQASVPVIYDDVADVSLMKGNWRQKLPNSMVRGRIKGDLFKKNI